jgi:hypothetical protein
MFTVTVIMNKIKQINVRLTDEDVAGLEEIERLTGSTRSEILRKYMRLGIARERENIQMFLGDPKPVPRKKKGK